MKVEYVTTVLIQTEGVSSPWDATWVPPFSKEFVSLGTHFILIRFDVQFVLIQRKRCAEMRVGKDVCRDAGRKRCVAVILVRDKASR
jgi:hypothetical protein